MTDLVSTLDEKAAGGRPFLIRGFPTAMLVLACATSCTVRSAALECIPEEQAVEIARDEAGFAPMSIEASRVRAPETPAWVVTLRDTSHPDPMGRVMIVTVACDDGRILELARN